MQPLANSAHVRTNSARARISVVIPIHNEAVTLEPSVRELVRKVTDSNLHGPFEIILSENGSRDETASIAERLTREIEPVRLLRSNEPNYGRALRLGIEAALGDYVVCDEIDLCDVDFYMRAVQLLDKGADLVVGSKRHPESRDQRPWIRRQGTATINRLLRLTLGFHGTDTHGLKAFRRERLMPVVRSCRVEHDLFASEFVIRAGRAQLDVREIPLLLREIRPPSVNLMRRVPRVLRDLARLVYVIRVRN